MDPRDRITKTLMNGWPPFRPSENVEYRPAPSPLEEVNMYLNPRKPPPEETAYFRRRDSNIDIQSDNPMAYEAGFGELERDAGARREMEQLLIQAGSRPHVARKAAGRER